MPPRVSSSVHGLWPGERAMRFLSWHEFDADPRSMYNPPGSVRPALSGGHSAREAHGAHATAATIATAPRAAFSLSIEILEDDNLGAREEASHRRGLLAWARRRNPRAVSSSRPAPRRASLSTLRGEARFLPPRCLVATD